ncbi:quinolinate synthase NadA [Ihubacter massiliensis]|uniref:Quinolinate synthase n=1 Tax=Hominibacterium faecale TaxID=2839743 RepID=A0A9J6QXQ7_9FIRM|nr:MULTISPECIES: quinolinate synthase NadA [Eubacteriales Family XIII. Incertae Sedis]MCI7301984.1 quinolinate synthase NadA [Clostridia bacterium]MCO7122081.1 quinolinate synthase NadA [Ihubacter massiliensis]MCU7380261.1 quinolinate synthase NadA [Hominibacterium faecale]MDY3012428.1 quinolinate synthase NadA [Clostridiales Family XIII bacterium]
MADIVNQIKKLKEENDVLILAHYYVDEEVQKIADCVGDSYYLSEKAVEATEQAILFCGVSFMGESAKILNPEKLVLMPDPSADCPMAHMATAEKIKAVRQQYDDLAVVCYINSTAEIKRYSDVCVTSSNAMKIVKSLPNKHILFVPDENLGRYIASKIPEKHFIFNDGYCYVHKEIKKEDVLGSKEQWPQAEVLAHPECTMEVLEEADYIGSTSGIIARAGESDAKEFIICTETGVFYELTKNNPDKIFHPAKEQQICSGMKQITLEKVLQTLESMDQPLVMDETARLEAQKPLTKMLELAQK